MAIAGSELDDGKNVLGRGLRDKKRVNKSAEPSAQELRKMFMKQVDKKPDNQNNELYKKLDESNKLTQNNLKNLVAVNDNQKSYLRSLVKVESDYLNRYTSNDERNKNLLRRGNRIESSTFEVLSDYRNKFEEANENETERMFAWKKIDEDRNERLFGIKNILAKIRELLGGKSAGRGFLSRILGSAGRGTRMGLEKLVVLGSALGGLSARAIGRAAVGVLSGGKAIGKMALLSGAVSNIGGLSKLALKVSGVGFAITTIYSFLSKVDEGLGPALDKISFGGTDFISKKLGFESTQKLVSSITGNINSAYQSATEFIKKEIEKVSSDPGEYFSDLPGRIWSLISGTFSVIQDKTVDVFENVNKSVEDYFTKTKTLADGKKVKKLLNPGELVDKVKGDISTLANNIGSVVKSGFVFVAGQETFSKIEKTLTNELSKIKESPGEYISDLPKRVYNAISNIFKSVSTKIGETFGNLDKDKLIKSVDEGMSNFGDFIQKFLKNTIHGTLKSFREIFGSRDMSKEIDIDGDKSITGTVASGSVDIILSAIKGIFNGLTQYETWFGGKEAKGIIPIVQEKLADILGFAIEKMGEAWDHSMDWIGDKIQNIFQQILDGFNANFVDPISKSFVKAYYDIKKDFWSKIPFAGPTSKEIKAEKQEALKEFKRDRLERLRRDLEGYDVEDIKENIKVKRARAEEKEAEIIRQQQFVSKRREEFQSVDERYKELKEKREKQISDPSTSIQDLKKSGEFVSKEKLDEAEDKWISTKDNLDHAVSKLEGFKTQYETVIKPALEDEREKLEERNRIQEQINKTREELGHKISREEKIQLKLLKEQNKRMKKEHRDSEKGLKLEENERKSKNMSVLDKLLNSSIFNSPDSKREANKRYFAKGGLFEGGVEKQITGKNQGSVVQSQTSFDMADGTRGVMAEKGPEAIMPLKRESGTLGVAPSKEHERVSEALKITSDNLSKVLKSGREYKGFYSIKDFLGDYFTPQGWYNMLFGDKTVTEKIVSGEAEKRREAQNKIEERSNSLKSIINMFKRDKDTLFREDEIKKIKKIREDQSGISNYITSPIGLFSKLDQLFRENVLPKTIGDTLKDTIGYGQVSSNNAREARDKLHVLEKFKNEKMGLESSIKEKFQTGGEISAKEIKTFSFLKSKINSLEGDVYNLTKHKKLPKLKPDSIGSSGKSKNYPILESNSVLEYVKDKIKKKLREKAIEGPQFFGGIYSNIIGDNKEKSFDKNVKESDKIFLKDGGVINEETRFETKSGKKGVMAEGDKPEAVMPLKRERGKLGVEPSKEQKQVNREIIKKIKDTKGEIDKDKIKRIIKDTLEESKELTKDTMNKVLKIVQNIKGTEVSTKKVKESITNSSKVSENVTEKIVSSLKKFEQKNIEEKTVKMLKDYVEKTKDVSQKDVKDIIKTTKRFSKEKIEDIYKGVMDTNIKEIKENIKLTPENLQNKIKNSQEMFKKTLEKLDINTKKGIFNKIKMFSDSSVESYKEYKEKYKDPELKQTLDTGKRIININNSQFDRKIYSEKDYNSRLESKKKDMFKPDRETEKIREKISNIKKSIQKQQETIKNTREFEKVSGDKNVRKIQKNLESKGVADQVIRQNKNVEEIKKRHERQVAKTKDRLEFVSERTPYYMDSRNKMQQQMENQKFKEKSRAENKSEIQPQTSFSQNQQMGNQSIKGAPNERQPNMSGIPIMHDDNGLIVVNSHLFS